MPTTALPSAAIRATGATHSKRRRALLKTGALETAILASANFSSIATDEHGVIRVFNVGAERLLCYSAAEVVGSLSAVAVCDPQDMLARAAALSAELGSAVAPGFETLVFKASRGVEDVYELTDLCEDVNRQTEALTGRTRERLIGAPFSDYFTEPLRAQACIDTVLSERQVTNYGLTARSSDARQTIVSFGFAQPMESGASAPSPLQRDSIEQILQAGWYLLELINEILDLALIDSGKLSLSPEPVSLAEVLGDCRAMIEPRARSRTPAKASRRTSWRSCSSPSTASARKPAPKKARAPAWW